MSPCLHVGGSVLYTLGEAECGVIPTVLNSLKVNFIHTIGWSFPLWEWPCWTFAVLVDWVKWVWTDALWRNDLPYLDLANWHLGTLLHGWCNVLFLLMYLIANLFSDDWPLCTPPLLWISQYMVWSGRNSLRNKLCKQQHKAKGAS